MAYTSLKIKERDQPLITHIVSTQGSVQTGNQSFNRWTKTLRSSVETYHRSIDRDDWKLRCVKRLVSI